MLPESKYRAIVWRGIDQYGSTGMSLLFMHRWGKQQTALLFAALPPTYTSAKALILLIFTANRPGKPVCFISLTARAFVA